MTNRYNPFYKHLKQEDHLQIQVSEWLQYQFPEIVWFHPPNEGRRTAFERYVITLLGVQAGASDMIILQPTKKYHGLMLELKVIYKSEAKNYLSKNQKKFLKRLYLKGYCCAVAWTFEEAKKIIEDYMDGETVDLTKYFL